MLGKKLGHFKHTDDRLSAKDLFQIFVSVDITPILRVLKTMRINIHPKFFYNFGSGHRTLADYHRQLWADVHRLHKSRICHEVCLFGLDLYSYTNTLA